MHDAPRFESCPQSHVICFAKFDRNERDWLYSPLWLAGAETAEVGPGTERRPGSRVFAGVTPEPRHPLLRNQNAYQSAAGWYKFRASPSTDSTFGAYTVSVTRQ